MAVNNTQIIVNNGNVQTVISTPSPSIIIAAGSSGSSLAVPPLSLVGNYTGATVNPPLFITLGTNLSFAGSVLNAAGVALANGNATTFNVNKVDLGGTLVQNTAIDGHFNLTIGSTTPVALFSVFGGLDLTTFSSLSLNLSAAQLRHFEPAGITGSLTLDSTSATLVGGLAGANPHTQIILSGTAATFTDTRATPVGLQEAADYSASYTNLSYTNKGYILGAKTYTGKQTFIQTTTTSPINLGGFASDPSVPLEGEISYNKTSHLLKFYDGTSWVSVNAAPPAWLLASGGTLTGVNTITSNAKNQLNFTGTWTATAASDAHIAFGGTLTAASGLGVTGYLFNPTLNAVGTSSVQVALDVKPTFSGGTAPINIAARFNDGLVVYNQSNSTATNRGFSLSSRDALVNFPVPSLRPTTLNKVMALDIMPNGSPTENAGNGFAWFDVVDADALTSEPPLRTARVGIKSTGAEFGSYSFNAGVQLPMIFTMSGTIFMSGTTSGRVLIGTHTAPIISEQLSVKKDQNGGTYGAIINGTSGTAAFAGLLIGASSTLTTRLAMYSFSPGWTTSGMEVASTSVLESTDANGLNIGTSANTPTMIWTNNVERARFLSTGEFSIGSTSVSAKVYINQAALSSGWIPTLRIDPGAHTSLTAATEFKDYNFNTRTATWLAGTTATQRFAHFQGQTVAGASASATFTDLYTVYIDPSIQGSQAIITNNWALGVGGVMSVGGVGTDGKVAFRRSSDAGIVGYMSSNGSGIDLGNGLTGSGTGGFRFIMGNSTVLNLFANTADLLIGSVTDLARLYVFQLALGTTGGLPAFRVDGGAHTNLTASVEVLFANFNSSAAVQYATGAQTILRNILVQAPTIGFVGASTITDNATFTISGAPKAGTNTTQTNTHGLLIQAGAVTSAGAAYGLTVNAPTGGTLNYAAQTKGGSFLFAAGTTTYAPIIIPTGTNLTTSAAGALENDGTHLWFTFANSGARWQLDNQVGTFGWALAGNTLVADGIIGDVGAGGFKISLYTNNTARQVIDSKGNFTFTQSAQSTSHNFITFNQGNHTGGTPIGLTYNAGGAVTLAANTEPTDIALLVGRTVQFNTGAHGGVRTIYINAPIYSFVGASTMAIASLITLGAIPAAGNNATITNVHGININSQSVVTGTGIVTNSYSLTVSAQTGAANNYAAQFLGGNVGIGLSAPLSGLDVAGSFGANTRTITTSATLAATDYTVLCDSTGGVVAVTLPTASGAKGRIYVVKKIDASANNVTLATVDGGTKTITTRYAGFAVQSDGSLWYVIGSF